MEYKILCGNTDITEYITSIKSSIEFDSETPLIGNAPSIKFDISIDNTLRIMDDILLDNQFYVYQNDLKICTLNITDMPEFIYERLDLTLYDNLIKTNVAYKTNTQMYPCTVVDQLEEMKSLLNLNIDYSNIPSHILYRTINQYDTGEFIRIYLCQIAEASCCNVFCNENGDIYFKKVSKDVVHDIENDDHVYSFSKSNKVTITMVVAELLNLYMGDESGSLLKITENNPYITTQEELNYIFNEIGGITFDSIESLNMRYIDGISVGEIVRYKDYFNIFARKIETTYHNGEKAHDVVMIDGKFAYVGKSNYIGNENFSSKLKRLKINVDELENSYEVIAEQQEQNQKDVSSIKISLEGIKGEVSKVVDTVYKFETGSNNIFENCNQILMKTSEETEIKRKSDMPLGINSDFMQGKDIVISVDINVKNAKLSDLGNYAGAEFDVAYKDGTSKTYSARWYPGQYLMQYLLHTDITSHFERIWMHYMIEDKEISSVSNLRMIIALDAEKATVSYPKVEFGTRPTGFDFDMNYIRDNIETIQKDYTLIDQKLGELTLQAVSMEEQITTIKGDVTSITTRLQSAEIKLQPTNILLAVNEQIGANGKLHTTKFVLDKDGVHISGGGLDIKNNEGTKVFYADTSGDLIINNLTANNGKFTGTITGSTITGGTISGASITGGSITSNTTINVTTDLKVGNNIYIGTYSDRSTKKYIYFNDKFFMASRNEVISFGVENGSTFQGKVYVDSRGNITLDSQSGSIVNVGSTVFIVGNNGGQVDIGNGKIDISGSLYVNGGIYINNDNVLQISTSNNVVIGYDSPNNTNIYSSSTGVINFARSGITSQCLINLGMSYNASYSGAIRSYWKDGQIHNLVERNADGLLSAFGWAGSASYSTVTRIRGRTCQYQNSSGTTTLSDINLKTDICNFDERYDMFFDNIMPRTYKLILGSSSRNHVGYITQEVEKALQYAGLTTKEFAGVNIMPVTSRETEIDKYGNEHDIPDSPDNYLLDRGINEQHNLVYTEFIALNTWQIQKVKKQLKELEKENNLLKQELKNVNDKFNSFINGNYEIRVV